MNIKTVAPIHVYINVNRLRHCVVKGIKVWHDRIGPRDVKSIFILMTQNFNADAIATVLAAMADYFNYDPTIEITVSLKQSVVSPDQIAALHTMGVNRISFGGKNNAMKSSHHPVLDVAKRHFDRVNIDAVSTDAAQLDMVFSYDPGHISFYDMISFDAFDRMVHLMTARGYTPYDRYHFCKPGHHAHYLNGILSYDDYIGIGQNAESRIRIDGQTTAFATKGIARRWCLRGWVNPARHKLSVQEQREEFLLQNLSRYNGFNPAWFYDRFGVSLVDVFSKDVIKHWIDNGDMMWTDTQCRLLGPMFFTPEVVVAELNDV